jgi:hypothetical protein
MPEVANAGPGYLWVKGADYEGVIASSADGSWTPSPQDVAALEVALGPAIAAHEMGKQHAAKDFKREYGGVEVSGARVIRVFLACDTPKTWPSEGLPSVKGGGTCYGYADWDMASKKLTRLDANSGK